jgi:hypothetical protein
VFCIGSHKQDLTTDQTCRRLRDISSLKIVWTNACRSHIIAKGFPFTHIPISSFSAPDLKSKVLNAYLLSKKWMSGMPSPQRTYYISGTSGTSVSDVRFLPDLDDRFLLTISKSVWSAVSAWDMHDGEAKMVARWSPRGAIFTGFAVNTEVASEATLAISVQIDG